MQYPSIRALTCTTEEERTLQIITGFFDGNLPQSSVFEDQHISKRNEGFRTFLIMDHISQIVHDYLTKHGYWISPSYRQIGKVEVTRLY